MKHVTFILILCTIFNQINAQSQKDSTFIFLDKDSISTHILSDMAVPLLNFNHYDGYADSIPVTAKKWRQLYFQTYHSFVEQPSIPDLDSLRNLEKNLKFENHVVPIAILNINYNCIKEYALDSNLLSLSNNKLYDVIPRSENPFCT